MRALPIPFLIVYFASVASVGTENGVAFLKCGITVRVFTSNKGVLRKMKNGNLERYESAEVKIVWFHPEDIITTSNLGESGEDTNNGEFGPLI